MRRALAGLLLAAVAATGAGTGAAEALGKRPSPLFPNLPTAEVKVTTATGVHDFAVWIAADDASRQRGLMYVRELPPDRGMLFLLDGPQQAAFWMKNTYLSLDLVFIGADGRVANVAHDAKPFSLMPIPSRGPVTAVLELVAGSARRIGLEAGDRVTWGGAAGTGSRTSGVRGARAGLAGKWANSSTFSAVSGSTWDFRIISLTIFARAVELAREL